MKTNSVSRRVVPFFTAALSAVLFGIATPASKYLLRDIHPFSLAGLLYLGASAGLLPVVIARKEFAALRGMNRANTRRLFGAVILGGIAGPVLLMFGLTQASASSVSLWLNLELVATSVLGYLFFRDYLGKAGWAGVLLALLSGVLLTVSEGRTGAAAAVLVGCACVCWGFDNHFTALIDGISAVQSTFVKGLFAGGITTYRFSAHGLPPSAMPVACAVALGVSYGVSIVLLTIMSAQKIGHQKPDRVFKLAVFGFFQCCRCPSRRPVYRWFPLRCWSPRLRLWRWRNTSTIMNTASFSTHIFTGTTICITITFMANLRRTTNTGIDTKTAHMCIPTGPTFITGTNTVAPGSHNCANA